MYSEEREANIRAECRGKAMVNCNLLYELFAVIHQLLSEQRILSDLLFQREHERDAERFMTDQNTTPRMVELTPHDS